MIKIKKIGIIKAGAWGTAIGKTLAEKGHRVEMHSSRIDVIDDINNNHKNSRYLPGVVLPDTVTASVNLAEVIDGKDYLFLALPSAYFIHYLKSISSSEQLHTNKPRLAILTKGFITIHDTPALTTDAAELFLPPCFKNGLVYISGPAHAEEVAHHKLTALICTAPNMDFTEDFIQLLHTSRLLLFSSADYISIQVYAAVKNIIAIAFGMLDGLAQHSNMYGDNARSLLLTYGVSEMIRIAQCFGSIKIETALSIAGIGDLDVTCHSKYGRNHRFGKEIILDKILTRFYDINDLIENTSTLGYYPEGINTVNNVHIIAQRYDLHLPICNNLYAIFNKKESPVDGMNNMFHGTSAVSG